MSSDSDESGSPLHVATQPSEEEGGRPQYANKCELMLSLVGFAVGLGNIWRFPYLAYQYGGAAFLVPYFVCLLLLGLPLFILELGLGQLFRQGTLGIWAKMGRRRMQGVGIAATICTWFVSLYYCTILAWTVYYMAATLVSIPSGEVPWSHNQEGFVCPPSVVFPKKEFAHDATLIDSTTGLFDQSRRDDFWCPPYGIPDMESVVNESYVRLVMTVSECPARAAVKYWQEGVLQQSSGMNDLDGFQYGLLASYTFTWVLVYFIVFQGVGSSGKVVYFTAIMPYVALAVFFVRAITLPNAITGLRFFLQPRLDMLFNAEVWQRAATQIFYSLGVGFGSLIAFASYGDKKDDYVGNAVKVSIINCGTSVFCGFVVFPILGYLAYEMKEINPCISGWELKDLEAIGLSGTGLAFIAFPIAISRMPGAFFWAFLFFLMLLCLGIDSEFAMIESVMTVIHDSGVADNLSKPQLAGAVCGVSWLVGLIFVTKGGIYWFNLFDYYSCVAALFFVTLMECFWLMWGDAHLYKDFKRLTEQQTGRKLPDLLGFLWKYVCPTLILGLLVLAFGTSDLMSAQTSKPYPDGNGYLPEWSIGLGWKLGLLPMYAFALVYLVSVEWSLDESVPKARITDKADIYAE